LDFAGHWILRGAGMRGIGSCGVQELHGIGSCAVQELHGIGSCVEPDFTEPDFKLEILA